MSLPPATVAEFDRFREMVFRDTELHARLLACADISLLLAAVAAAAAESGCHFSLDDAKWIYDRNRRDWLERTKDR